MAIINMKVRSGYHNVVLSNGKLVTGGDEVHLTDEQYYKLSKKARDSLFEPGAEPSGSEQTAGTTTPTQPADSADPAQPAEPGETPGQSNKAKNK